MVEVYKLLGLKKVNTTAYHPQTDGLVERFNRTLTDMLSKKVLRSGKDWDVQLPYVLFAYRASPQQSTEESPFFLLYGRDPAIPTDQMLKPSEDQRNVEVDDYRREIVLRMSAAWEAAQSKIKNAQRRQKHQHDKRARDPKVCEGDRVFLYTPAERTGKAYKFARPFKGPYRVKSVIGNGVELLSIGKPNTTPLRVALNRIRHCPMEIADGLTEEITEEESEDDNISGNLEHDESVTTAEDLGAMEEAQSSESHHEGPYSPRRTRSYAVRSQQPRTGKCND